MENNEMQQNKNMIPCKVCGKMIAKNAKNWIKPDGKIYIEIGAGQSAPVRKIFNSAGWKFIRADRDLGNIIRVLVFTI